MTQQLGYGNSVSSRLPMQMSTSTGQCSLTTMILPHLHYRARRGTWQMTSNAAKRSAYILQLMVGLLTLQGINLLLSYLGRPCDINGEFLPNGSPPAPWEDKDMDDFSPFANREVFELADLLYRRNEMPQHQIDDLLQVWARTLPPEADSLFTSAQDLYSTLDAIDLADVCWQSFSLSYKPKDGDDMDATWKTKEFEVWYRDPCEVLKAQLSNHDFSKEMDFAPKIVIDREKRTRRYQDFMSGEWAWEQAVCIHYL
jgi:hypothetical protein